MSLFNCDRCGVVENTALSRYWLRSHEPDLDGEALCSECDPAIGRWHGRFEREFRDLSVQTAFEQALERVPFAQRTWNGKRAGTESWWEELYANAQTWWGRSLAVVAAAGDYGWGELYMEAAMRHLSVHAK